MPSKTRKNKVKHVCYTGSYANKDGVLYRKGIYENNENAFQKSMFSIR